MNVISSVYSTYLSQDDPVKYGQLVLQFHLQVHESEFVSADLECVICPQNTGEPDETNEDERTRNAQLRLATTYISRTCLKPCLPACGIKTQGHKSACQISADSEQLENSQRNTHIRLS